MILAGQVITGTCVSFTVTVNWQVLILPDASVAVTVTVVVPTGKKLPDAGTLVTTTPGQLSVAVGVKLTLAPHWPAVLGTIIFAGQVTTGNCTSLTLMVNVQMVILPDASVAVQVTVVMPTGKKLPEAGLVVILTPGQLSETCGPGYTTIAPHCPTEFVVTIFAGQMMVGNWVSLTVTVNVQVFILLDASFAVTTTVVVPIGKKVPEAGLLDTVTPGQLSVATGAAHDTNAPQLPAELLTVMLAGHVTTGNCVSTTFTWKVHTATLPARSVEVIVTKVIPTGNTLPDAGTMVVVMAPGQLSVTAGVGKFTTALHRFGSLLTTSPTVGQAIVGACVSFILTVKEQVAVLPEASVAVTFTVVVPTGKKLPDAGTETIVTPGQLSVAVGTKVTTAPQRFRSLPLTILAGQVTTGACVSFTLTVNVQVEPDALVDVTVVVPIGKNEPAAGTEVIIPQKPVEVVAG